MPSSVCFWTTPAHRWWPTWSATRSAWWHRASTSGSCGCGGGGWAGSRSGPRRAEASVLLPRQAPVTVLAPIVAARRSALDELLLGGATRAPGGVPDRSSSAALGLPVLGVVPFARLFVLEAAQLSTG